MDTRTIVIIEDDAVARSQAVDLFESAGLQATAFASGDEAVDFVRANRNGVACIFTDYMVEGPTDGLAVANMVVAVLPEIAVVMTSGIVSGRPHGLDRAVRFLPKPWHPLDVISAVQDAKLDGPG